jgi:hypothetical protein
MVNTNTKQSAFNAHFIRLFRIARFRALACCHFDFFFVESLKVVIIPRKKMQPAKWVALVI